MDNLTLENRVERLESSLRLTLQQINVLTSIISTDELTEEVREESLESVRFAINKVLLDLFESYN